MSKIEAERIKQELFWCSRAGAASNGLYIMLSQRGNKNVGAAEASATLWKGVNVEHKAERLNALSSEKEIFPTSLGAKNSCSIEEKGFSSCKERTLARAQIKT